MGSGALELVRIVAGALPAPKRLRAALAASVGDPDLEIVYFAADGRSIDADGQPAPPPRPAVAVTDVKRGAASIAQLRHAVAPERLAAAARGAAPALEHAALRSTLRADLAQLAASRSRIIATGDAERRRIERNLHDGAQQRLIALAVALEGSPEASGRLDRARNELLAALEALRALAHGIHPISLTEAGLGAALRELADGSPVPIRIDALPTGRFAASAEAAAYRLVLDATRCAPILVTLALEHDADALRVTLSLPGVERPVALAHLQPAADRIAALEGDLVVAGHDDGVTVTAQLPCAS